ncbi:hypothetical protein tinsulaeT_35380 [Thalassotalea insulae]|uniref:HTH araC/xylS-type domain-containing protein n=1 Tax=Thalassotalea insulae TaxID=2056778 RepID=A0ABQ6GW85_9GAMM|nr:helix-turn-helix domain-containing protein [Thalassotalea insulae]GLX80198.1 hypothetical protein tinsulaeT_35380 [Thalassotalea insulae]
MATPLNFHLFQPKGKLSPYLQGIWSASVPQWASEAVCRTLLSDACSGITFVLAGKVKFGDAFYSQGVVISPTSKEAQTLILSPGTVLAGIRFHSGIGFGLLGQHFSQPQSIQALEHLSEALNQLYLALLHTQLHYSRIYQLYLWCSDAVNDIQLRPISLTVALNKIKTCDTLAALSQQLTIGQRQLERQFKQWVDITPKHYQRIWRVKETLEYLKHNTDANLAALALEYGYNDQAHMYREIKLIAKVTPKAFTKRYL